MPHYTSNNQDALIGRVTSDFIGQIAQRLETAGTSQSDLAERLGVSEAEVSQVLNLNRINLTLKLMTRYARALGMKIAVVAYDDNDPTNQNGPVGSEIFNLSWEKIGRPRTIWSVNANAQSFANTREITKIIVVNPSAKRYTTRPNIPEFARTNDFSHYAFEPVYEGKSVYARS